jgi:hypothetical protein
MDMAFGPSGTRVTCPIIYFWRGEAFPVPKHNTGPMDFHNTNIIIFFSDPTGQEYFDSFHFPRIMWMGSVSIRILPATCPLSFFLSSIWTVKYHKELGGMSILVSTHFHWSHSHSRADASFQALRSAFFLRKGNTNTNPIYSLRS